MGALGRLRTGPQWALVLIILAAAVAFALWRQGDQPFGSAPPAPEHQQPTSADTTGSVQMLLGNPSGATPDPANRANYLMIKPYYALAYNDYTGTANWVSWRLASADLGSAPRKLFFDPDEALPRGFYQVIQRDYTDSGFDRGHLCPHGDRSANEAMSFGTFVMTNIIPQAPDVNRKAWAQLEIYCRELVSHRHHRLYIIAGPAGRGGRGSDGPKAAIAGGKITVPAECWKVIVVVPEGSGDNDLARINRDTRVIAVVMPNVEGAVGDAWAEFRTSAADIERRAGLKFFDRLPPDLAEVLRQKVDQARIPPPRPNGHGKD